MKKLRIQILLLLLLSATLSFAQENWANLITPQSIHEIVEIDNKLYCATEGGLVIYDQAAQSLERQLVVDDIPSHRVEDITRDAAGNIWIGTYDNGLARMTSGGWESLEIDQDLAGGLTYCIEFDDNGVLWAGTLGGLLKYENNEWVKEDGSTVWDMEKDDQGVIHIGGEVPGRLENGVLIEYSSSANGFANTYRISHIDYGPNGEIYWASGETEVVIYDGSTWTVYDRDDMGLPNTPGGQDPTDIIYTSAGEVWVAFKKNGIYKFDGNDWTEIYTVEHPEAHIQFLETSDGDFIISIDNKLYEYDNGFSELADLSIGFDNNEVKIAANEQGEMLVLGGSQGIKYDAQLNPTALSILAEVDDYSVLDFLVHPDGSIGFINIANGDSYYNGQTQVNIPSSIPVTIAGINDYIVDSEGDYWLTTAFGLIRSEQGALTVYDAANTPFISDFSSNDWVKIQTVAEDRNGDIWVSGEYKVARWERATETWVDYFDAPQNEDNSIIGLSRIYFDENNVLWGGAASDFVWSGTSSIGLTRLDGDTWTSYTPQNSNLESYFVNDIQEVNGQLALATDAGMSLFDGTNFMNFNRENSDIGSAYCNKIEADGQGNIWISSTIVGSTGHGGISIYNNQGIATNNEEVSSGTPTPVYLYPNPAKTFFQIDNKYLKEIPLQIQVFDLNGRLVKTLANTYTVDTDDMPSGMYAVLIQTKKQQYVAKVLVVNQ